MVIKIVSCGGVFDLAVEQPQLFRKLPKNKNNEGAAGTCIRVLFSKFIIFKMLMNITVAIYLAYFITVGQSTDVFLMILNVFYCTVVFMMGNGKITHYYCQIFPLEIYQRLVVM